MPGIIPMKLIKCGSSQTRIAQACDRCRSKKIRCDGVRPCCSQCANVGFECKTSDKLSRRAFPRGYTESLEERVRCLEREVRELKELLDAKDEQLEMVSKIHSFSPYSPPSSDASRGTQRTGKRSESVRSNSEEAEEVINIEHSGRLVKMEGQREGLYMGASSGRGFVETVKQRMEQSQRYATDFETEQFFQGTPTIVPETYSQTEAIKAPPRLLSDHLLVAYFQEYHPLFPVLHRPTFLASYEKLVSTDPSAAAGLSQHDIAKLFLVFAIALQQQEPRSTPDQHSFDFQWQRALDSVVSETSINTVQCLVLAQLYCFGRGDYSKLLHYKNLAVGIALRLGLNHSQRKFALGALGGEMRKRAFWCVYTLDGFSAALLGLPTLLDDRTIDAEYPSDIDDEYVSDEGFLPTLPGDSTKISSALALFRCARVLVQVLNIEYNPSNSETLTYSKLRELEDELDNWKSSLAPHLRLEFVNGLPATNIVHSRSPLLVLAYNYIKLLIHLPLLNLPHHAASSLVAVRDAAKHIVQLLDLLTERGLGFAFCLNKAQTLLLCGFVFIYSTIDSGRDGVLAKENQKLLTICLREMGAGQPIFAGIASAVITAASPVQSVSPHTQHISPIAIQHQSVSPHASISPHQISKSLSPELNPSSLRRTISAVSSKLKKTSSAHRRSSMSQDPVFPAGEGHNQSTLSRIMSASMADLHHRGSPLSKSAALASRHSISYEPSSLDFLWGMDPSSLPESTTSTSAPSHGAHSLGASSTSSGHSGMGGSQGHGGAAAGSDDWERMLAMMDAHHAAHIYGDGNGGRDVEQQQEAPGGQDFEGDYLIAGQAQQGLVVDQRWGM